MRTRDEIEHDRTETLSDAFPDVETQMYVVQRLMLEVLLDMREFLSEHAIAHHLLNPELKAEIAEMIASVTDDITTR